MRSAGDPTDSRDPAGDARVRGLPVPAPQHAFHVAQSERLAEIIVHACRQAGLAVALHGGLGLPEAGRSTIPGQLKGALGALNELADKVLALAGVGDKIRPAMEAIMGKLNARVA
jgi:hypothetical protein